MNQFQEKFREEALELIAQLENDIVALETDCENSDIINNIFRNLHTIKGSGSMFGYQHLADFVHYLETLFDRIRNAQLHVNPDIISVSLKSIDLIKYQIDDPELKSFDWNQEDSLLKSIKQILDLNPLVSNVKKKPQSHTVSKSKAYRIYFKPYKDIFINGINPLVIFKNLESIGKFYIYVHDEEIPSLEDFNPEYCYLSWTCILISEVEKNDIQDIFIFVESSCELKIEEIFDNFNDLDDVSIPLTGEILLQKGDITKNDIDNLLSNRQFFGETAIVKGMTTPDKVEAALFEQNALRSAKKELISHTTSSSIRVQNEKLNTLTNAVSELVTLQARLTQYSEQTRESELVSIAEYLEKLTSSLRDTVMMIRMVPVEDGFSSMHRLVRDLSRDLNKKVKLEIIGGDTELDKAVVDNLKDPMMHLVRNCVDHGLESPNDRIAAGKSLDGIVTIKAEHIGSHVLISVSDDGKGLDAQKIHEKALQKGIVSKTDNLTEQEIFKLIFLPGFSTAEKTTAVSGRGVGMDVVKRNIESIRGEVFIDSVKGKGTKISMKLPLTLAIIDGLLFSVGDELFVVNISAVSECLELTPEIKRNAGSRNILKLRDMVIPFVYLRSILNIPGNPPEHEQIIILHTQEQTIGFVVDTVAGKHQTVVKMTGRLFSNVKEVTGATILGDGRIALILDVNAIAQKANREMELTEV